MDEENFGAFMKLKIVSKIAVAAVAALPFLSAYGQSNNTPDNSAAIAPAPAARPVMATPSNVGEVIKLSQAGLGNDVVLSFVNGSQSFYNLSADEIVRLKDSGVSPAVITAMLNHDVALRNSNPNPFGPGAGYGTMPQSPAQTGQVSMPQQAPPDQATVQQPAPTTVVVQQPGPTQVEYVPVSPGPDYYWAPGYWGPDGIWLGGGWLRFGIGYGYGWGGYRGWYGGRGFGGGFRGGGFHGGGGGFHGHR
jgi:uncharacterized membrane protein YgcG